MPLTDEARAKGRATAAANRAKRKAAQSSKVKVPKPVTTPTPVPAPGATMPDESGLFDVEEAPEGIFPQGSALDKVFKKLGLKGDTHEEKEYKGVPSAKLTKAQQSLYDSFAPLAIQAFVVCAGWSWSLVGEEYRGLAPSDEVAEKIVAPLMRIYARTSQISTSMNPNHMDAAASLAALVGYVWSSLMIYQEIKQEKAANEQSGIDSTRYNGNGQFDTSQSGYGRENSGRDATRANGSNDRAAAQSNGNEQPGVNLSNLSESERRAYDKLSQLRERDYQSRLRRSGNAG
jgi:hypothetical protein